MAKKRDFGFTLIELLIVITIIGLLSAMILVGLGRVRSLGRDTRRLADLRQVQNGLELYFNVKSSYPKNISSWGTGQSGGGGLSTALIDDCACGINRIPLDPINSGTYVYSYGSDADGLNYVLSAKLENTNNPGLNDDVDGTLYGINCADPIYCVRN